MDVGEKPLITAALAVASERGREVPADPTLSAHIINFISFCKLSIGFLLLAAGAQMNQSFMWDTVTVSAFAVSPSRKLFFPSFNQVQHGRIFVPLFFFFFFASIHKRPRLHIHHKPRVNVTKGEDAKKNRPDAARLWIKPLMFKRSFILPTLLVV